MSQRVQSRLGGASCRSSNVRNAPLATLGPKKAACREGPLAEINQSTWLSSPASPRLEDERLFGCAFRLSGEERLFECRKRESQDAGSTVARLLRAPPQHVPQRGSLQCMRPGYEHRGQLEPTSSPMHIRPRTALDKKAPTKFRSMHALLGCQEDLT
jgi:hypothetical protein